LLKKINQKPQDCLFVDDCRENVNMAKRIGFNVILFKSLKQFNRELVNLKIA
jgi:FMN phosphatase YigB (HAD superfamily)